MGEASNHVAGFVCEDCGTRYRWKRELAGRKVKCRCGRVMTCPFDADDGMYGVAEAEARDVTVVAAKTQAVPVAVLAGPAVPYRHSSGSIANEQPVVPDPTIDLYLPLALLAGGALIQAGNAAIGAMRGTTDVRRTMIELATGLTISPAIMLVGLFIAAKFRGIELGNLLIAILKLAAIAIAPSALTLLLTPISRLLMPVGGLALWVVEFALYFALLGTLFKMDEEDTWYCVCVFFVLNVAIYLGMKHGLGLII